jgi:hypothetical protein
MGDLAIMTVALREHEDDWHTYKETSMELSHKRILPSLKIF